MKDDNAYYLDALNYYYPAPEMHNTLYPASNDPDHCSVNTDGCSVTTTVCSVKTDVGPVTVMKVVNLRNDSTGKRLELEERQDNENDPRDRGYDTCARRHSPVNSIRKNESGDDDSAASVIMHDIEGDFKQLRKYGNLRSVRIKKQKQSERTCSTFLDIIYDSFNLSRNEEDSLVDSLSSGGSTSQSEDEMTFSSDETDIEGECVEVNLSHSIDGSEGDSKNGEMAKGSVVDPPFTCAALPCSCQNNEAALWDGLYDVLHLATNYSCTPWNNEADNDSLSSAGTNDDTAIEGCECVEHGLYKSLTVDEVLQRAVAAKIDLDRLVLSLLISSRCCKIDHKRQLSSDLATEDEAKKEDNATVSSPIDLTNLSSSSKTTPYQTFHVPMQSTDVTLQENPNDDHRSATEVKAPPLVFDLPASIPETALKQSHNNPTSCNQSSLDEVNDGCQSGEVDSGTARSTNKFDSVAKVARTQELETMRFAAQQPDVNNQVRDTPPSVLIKSLLNEITPKQTNKSLLPSITAPPLLVEGSSCSLTPTPKWSFNSILSPAANSRLESWASRLRRISQEHRLRNVLRAKMPRRKRDSEK